MVRLRVLGAIELNDSSGRELTAILAQPKRLALLIYLAANPQPFHRRDTLLALLWPDLDETRGRNALNQATAFLRRELGGSAALVSRGDEIGIDAAHVSCDAFEFRQAIGEGRLADALELYRDDLLSGFHVDQAEGFEEWQERERARVRGLATRAAQSLAERLEREGNLAGAVQSSRRALELSAGDEVSLRQLLGLLDRTGDKAGAIRTYNEFARRFAADFGSEPSSETTALIERIRDRKAAHNRVDAYSAPEMQSAIVTVPVAGANRRRIKKALPIAGVIGAAWATIAALGAFGVGPAATLRSSGRLRAREPMLVADFNVGGVDSVVGRAIAHAVRVSLGDSREVQLVSRDRMAETLELMRRTRGSFVDLELAREIAKRDGIRAIVGGHVVRTGERFDVGLRLVATDSGGDLAVLHASAENLDDVIPTIDKLTRQLRGRIGESVRTVRTTPPLPRATTASMEALTLYAQSLGGTDFRTMAALTERAVQIDTEFAIAWRRLATLYGNLNIRLVDRDSAAARAYRFRHKTSMGERLRIESYVSALRGDLTGAIAANEQILMSGDSASDVLSQLGEYLHQSREFERAARAQRRALELSPSVFIYYGNVAEKLINLNRLDEADSILRTGLARLGNVSTIVTALVRLRYFQGRLDEYGHALDSLRMSPGPTNQRVLTRLAADFALTRGRLQRWKELSAEQEILGKATGGTQAMADRIAPSLVDLWVRRDTARAVARVQVVAAERPLTKRELITVGEFYASAGRVDLAKAFLARFAATADSADHRRFTPFVLRVQAGIASAEGRFAEALEAARRGDIGVDGRPVNQCVICLYARLGHVYDRAHMTDSAIAMYQRYVETPNSSHIVEDGLHLASILERLGELHEAQGNVGESARYSARFAELWKNADAELQPRVTLARARAVKR